MVRDVGNPARVRRVGFSCRDDMVTARNALRAYLVPSPALQSAIVRSFPRHVRQHATSSLRRELAQLPGDPRSAVKAPPEKRRRRFGVDLKPNTDRHKTANLTAPK